MRGIIPNEKLTAIRDKLPQIASDWQTVVASDISAIDVYLSDLANEEQLHTALVCLDDAISRYHDVCFALFEAHACLAWYRECAPDAPLEESAVSTCKFYCDYVTLLLYAIAEDISFFIIKFLDAEIPLNEYKDEQGKRIINRKGVSSNAGKVGIFLKEKLPEHEITALVLALHQNREWKQAISYRNEWVHAKPPVIKGTGIQYDRNNRIRTTAAGNREFPLGYGSLPKYTVDEFLLTVLKAAHALTDTLNKLLEIVRREREILMD